MIVLDTHVWLWMHDNDARLSATARQSISAAGVVGIPAICFWEVAMLDRYGRITIKEPVVDWLKIASTREKIRVLPITPEIAAESAAVGLPHGDPADRLIVATALAHGAPLVTKDGKIADAGVVKVIW